MTAPELPPLPDVSLLGTELHGYVLEAYGYTDDSMEAYAIRAIEQDRKVRATQELPVLGHYKEVDGHKRLFGHEFEDSVPVCDHTLAMQRIEALDAEVGHYMSAQTIAYNQAMENGQRFQEAKARIAALEADRARHEELFDQVCEQHEVTIKCLQEALEEIEAMKPDVARYQWFKTRGVVDEELDALLDVCIKHPNKVGQ